MTVQTTINKNTYQGDGVTKTFPITFAYNTEHTDYIHVYVRKDGEMEEINNFVLDTTNNTVKYPLETEVYDSDGNLVEAPALAEGDTITIMRKMPLTQEMNLVNQGPFFAESIETAFDDAVLQIQQVNEIAGRALTIAVDSDEDPNTAVERIYAARDLVEEKATSAEIAAQTAISKAAAAAVSATAAAAAQSVVESTADVVVANITTVKNNALSEMAASKSSALSEITSTAAALIDPLTGAEQRATQAATTAEDARDSALAAKTAAISAKDVAIEYTNQSLTNATNAANSATIAGTKAGEATQAKNDAAEYAEQASTTASSMTSQLASAVATATASAAASAASAAASAEIAQGCAIEIDVEETTLVIKDAESSPIMERIAELQEENDQQSAEIVKLQRKTDAIWDMGNNIFYKFETDTNAGNKSIPSGAKVCDIDAYGGKSFVANQLFDYIANATSNGGVWSYDSTTKEISFDDTNLSTSVSNSYALNQGNITFTSGHKYFIWSNKTIAGINIAYWSGSTYALAGFNTIMTCSATVNNPFLRCVPSAYTKISGVQKFKLNIIDLTQAGLDTLTVDECKLAFDKYMPPTNPTLTNQSVEIVKVKGKNLCKVNGFSANDINNEQNNFVNSNPYGTTIQSQGNKVIVSQSTLGNSSAPTSYTNGYFAVALDVSKLTVGKTYCLSFDVTFTKKLTEFTYIYVFPNGANSVSKSVTPTLNQKQRLVLPNFVWENNTTKLSYIEIRVNGSSGIWENFMITEQEDSNYSPYHEPQSITIPTDWAVLKSAGSVYDERQFYSEEQTDGTVKYYCKYIKRIGQVDLGSLGGYYNSAQNIMTLTSPDDIKLAGNYISIANVLCKLYTSDTGNNVYGNVTNKTIAVHANQKRLWIYDNAYTDFNIFKSAIDGVILYYELATPTETVTELSENLFENITVEGNGSIEFVGENDYNMPIPNTETYLISLAEV